MKKSLQFKNLLTAIFVFFASAMMAQTVANGIVSAENDLQGLVGATILEKGTNNGVVSDDDGKFTITVAPGATLVISYVGSVTEEILAAADMTVKLRTDGNFLSEQVVTASRQPVRKLETTVAIDIISNKQLEISRPEGIAEAVRNVPGVFVSNVQGRFRGTVYIRGFPDGSGNGLVYTSLLLDGLPTLATPARPADFSFGMDLNVDRVEVVRGGAATLFGRASAAGVINTITKMGGTTHKGEARVTYYNSNIDRRSAGLDYKVDLNLNGPLSKNVRYNVGGYYVYDNGFRDLGYPDKGGQIRSNVDFMLGKGNNIRVYGMYSDIAIQNMIDIPYDAATLKPKSDWKITDSHYTPALDALSIRVVDQQVTGKILAPYDTTFRSVKKANEEGNYARGFHTGVKMDFDLGNGWSVTEHLRIQNFKEGTKFNLGSGTFYNPKTPAFGVRSKFDLRFIIDGDGRSDNVFNEFRLNKKFELGKTSHNFSAGTYYSREDYTPKTFSWTFWSSANKDSLRVGPAPFSGAQGDFVPLSDTTKTLIGGRSRIEHYLEDVTAFFAGDEIKIGDKTTVNLGIRYDRIDLKLEGFNSLTTVLRRDTSLSDYSASAGINHILTERSAVYLNYTRAFRMPDYSAFTVIAYSPGTTRFTTAPDGIPKNEIINNFELGYRSGFGELGLDAAAFYTTIDNRLAVFYENGIGVSRPQGQNSVKGFELGLSYVSSAIRGLSARVNMTYQNSIYENFILPIPTTRINGARVPDVDPKKEVYGNTVVMNSDSTYYVDLKGKQLPFVPGLIGNLIVNYDAAHFGVNANWNLLANRYFDATNIVKAPIYNTINMGAYGKFKLGKGEGRIDFLVKNLINSDDVFSFLYVSDNVTILKQKQINPDLSSGVAGFVSGIPQLPRRFLVTLSYKF